MIKVLLRKGTKSGVKIHNFSAWLHRKYGNLVIWRDRHDGVLGTSLPCVLFRKAIEKYNIQWVAYTGDGWIHSKRNIDILPKSKPTNKQRRYMNFKS